MPEENYQKIKLLKIMEILRQETDEEHPMTKVELAARLVAMNVSCSPRSLIRDIKLLNEQGYEITERLIGHEKAYFVCDRSFSVPELKILIDAVQAASFVTEKKTGELVDKIAALGGSHRAAILKGNMVKFNARKHRNETVYYTVGYLEDAIMQNRKVAFKYFDVTETGQRAFRRDGAEYVMEPVALVFNEDNYYLITYNEKHEATTNYRVDRIDSVRILDDPISETARSLRRKVARYTEEAFKMFNGQQETVTLRFADKLIGPVLDKFGEDTKMTRVDDHTIEATVQVRIAPTFWGWLFQFGTDMDIVEPEALKEEYIKTPSETTCAASHVPFLHSSWHTETKTSRWATSTIIPRMTYSSKSPALPRRTSASYATAETTPMKKPARPSTLQDTCLTRSCLTIPSQSSGERSSSLPTISTRRRTKTFSTTFPRRKPIRSSPRNGW